MKIHEFADNDQLDELSAGEVGAGLGKGVRAVGTGVKNFAKGFGQGLMGNVPGKGKNAAPKGNPSNTVVKSKVAGNVNIDAMKKSIAALNPKQRVALRTQIAKKAGVA